MTELRNRRKRLVRAKTIPLRVRLLVLDDRDALPPRPETRGQCENVPRPCPYVSCKYHLYLDETDAGGVKLNFPDIEPDQMKESCTLDIADKGSRRLEDVGELMNITRERVRQIENRAMNRPKLKRVAEMLFDANEEPSTDNAYVDNLLLSFHGL